MWLASQAVRLAPARGVVVLGGLTGTGKTDLLSALASSGEAVLDLEALASHRGSAFGGIGLPRQPTRHAFARTVNAQLAGRDATRRLWIEDEGPFIGRCGLPAEAVDLIRTGPVLELVAGDEARVERIVATYTGGAAAPSDATRAALVGAIDRSARRLGPERAARARELVLTGDLHGAVRVLLPAYDAAYRHRMATAGRRVIGQLAVD